MSYVVSTPLFGFRNFGLIVIEIFLKILINKDMLPDLNMYYGKMSDLVSFP